MKLASFLLIAVAAIGQVKAAPPKEATVSDSVVEAEAKQAVELARQEAAKFEFGAAKMRLLLATEVLWDLMNPHTPMPQDMVAPYVAAV